MTCAKYCEVCSCTVEVDERTNQVHSCGLDNSDENPDGLDYGYLNDCPFESEFSVVDDYEDDAYIPDDDDA